VVEFVSYVPQRRGQNLSLGLEQAAAQRGEPPEERPNLDHLLPHI
jgi:hypothetical protein